jgi:probable lipoprotein NlpC
MNKSRFLSVAVALWVVLTGCDPAKRVQKYAYLLDNKPKEKEVVTPPVKAPDEEVKASSDEILPSGKIKTVIKTAETYLGTPYRYGGVTKEGIDCSALTLNSYNSIGVALPRSSKDQSAFGDAVERKNLKPGDLVFFDAKSSGKIDHVGMVTAVKGEKTTFIHATVNGGVRYDQLESDYWSKLFVSARRPPQKSEE